MADKTAISWTDHTFNLWWGCEHATADDPTDPALVDMTAISEECAHCYAESFDHRLGGEHWGHGAEPKWASESYWGKLAKWNARGQREQRRRRVFVSSMSDWAQRHADPAINARMDVQRARLWSEIQRCPWLDFLLLTKRAERLAELLPWHYRPGNDGGRWMDHEQLTEVAEPWPNVWVGVTCGTPRSLWRIAKLRDVRAAVRFVSCEPLLEQIAGVEWDDALRYGYYANPFDSRVHWLIVGDESGSGRRPTAHAWVATARDAAERHGVAFHLKQLHVDDKKVHLPMFRGRVHNAFPGGR